MYSAISQSSALVPAWLGKDLISVKRPFCLFVCSLGLEQAGMKAHLSLGLWSGKIPSSPPGKHLLVQPLKYLASLYER